MSRLIDKIDYNTQVKIGNRWYIAKPVGKDSLKFRIKSAIEKENDRLLELCMFALLPKRIYNHELADKTKEAFKNIIKKNINEDTYTIRNEIVRYWDGKTKK